MNDKSKQWRPGARVLRTVKLELEDGFAAPEESASWKSASKVLPTQVVEPDAPKVQVELDWIDSANGRATPIQNGRYVPTARIVGEETPFSVVVELADETHGTLRLLNPGLVEVQNRIGPGTVLEIMEGP